MLSVGIVGIIAAVLQSVAAPVGACSRATPEYEVFEIYGDPADDTMPAGASEARTDVEELEGMPGPCSACPDPVTYAKVTLIEDPRQEEIGWYIRVIDGDDRGLHLDAEPIILPAGDEQGERVFAWLSAEAPEDLELTLGFRPVDRAGTLGEEIEVVFGG